MEITYSEGTVVKRSSGPLDDRRIEREAALLAAGRHAGVIALLDSGSDAGRGWLRLHDAGGVTLASMLAGGATPGDEDLIRLVGGVATTVADLHDIGIVHGAIEPAHVLVDPAGKPLLCSLGRGGRIGQDRSDGGVALDAQVDVRALGALLQAVLDQVRQPELWALAGQASRAGSDNRRGLRELSARAIAEGIGTAGRWTRRIGRPAAPVALGRTGGRGPTGQTRRGAGAIVAGLAVAATAVAILLGTVGAVGPSGPARRAVRTAPASPPGTVPGGPAFAYSQGVLAFAGERYAVGQPGDHVALGRWWCGPPGVALLRADGAIYVFDGLATSGADRPGRLISRVPGAVWLRPQTDPATGCDLLVAGGPLGRAILRPAPPS